MEVKKRTYEFLARWNQDGTLSGAHVQFRHVISENGEIVGEHVGHAEPVALAAGEKGFPISDILGQLHIDAISALDAEKKEHANTADKLNAALAEIDQTRIDHAREIAALKQDLESACRADDSMSLKK